MNMNVWNTVKQPQILKKLPGFAILIFSPQFRSNVSLFVPVVRLMPVMFWNFLQRNFELKMFRETGTILKKLHVFGDLRRKQSK